MIRNSFFFWWFFPSMSLYEWDHRRQDPYKKFPWVTPYTLSHISSWSPFCPNSAHFSQKKKVAHKHSWLFRSFFNLQWVNIRLLSLLRIRDLREWHDNFTTKKAFFAISQIVSFIRKKVCIANFLGKAKSVDKGKYYSKCLISSKTQNLSVKAFYE